MLKAEAARLGFGACGISRAQRLDDEAKRLEQWLHASMHASMSWMEDNFDKRVDPALLVPGARSVVSVIENYYQPIAPPDDPALGRVSRYAWGDDYHNVLKKKLVALLTWLSDTTGIEVAGRAFVDSAPVMDKAWAQRAGLGWIGKNGNLLRKNVGSWFFIGELIVDVELEPDGPAFDHCGSCTACIDACPTDAIVGPYVVDSNLCISYLTIEHREDDIDPNLASRAGNWIFGCDVCQEVCPWNKFRKAATEVRYYPRRGTIDTPLTSWVEVEDERFSEQYAGSPVRRAGASGIRRNARGAIRNLKAADRPE